MDALREQCPWNAAQTMESIRPLTEEEVYELSDAIMKKDMPGVCKEIGDLLYHMIFYTVIAQEQGAFDIADSLNKVCDKMVFRHPHVFGPEAGKPTTAKEIADTWELVKAKEKGGNKTVMSGIPDAMPALLKAMSVQEKARGCGFDWQQPADVWPKVLEEVSEAREACFTALEEAQKTSTSFHPSHCPSGPAGPSHSRGHGRPRSSEPLPDSVPQASTSPVISTVGNASPVISTVGNASPVISTAGNASPVISTGGEAGAEKSPSARMTEEFGDLLFAVINAARLYGVDAEAALNGACSKFRRRFNYVEQGILSQGRTLSDATLADMDALWDEAKAKGL